MEGFRRIYRMPLGGRNGQHFGARIVEAPDGALFLTVGDRGEPDLAQDFGRDNGAVLRVTRNGDIPADNLFASSWSAPRVFSKGHRNPQGAALDGEGRLWIVEHGAQGGDELNRVEAGRNYGWPAISYGLNYDGSKIGVGTEKAGMEQPEHYWDPSIAPSGLAVYSGRMIPQWAGDFLVGSLKFDMIARLDADAGMVEERLSAPETGRVRDVREAPDGSIWFLSVYDGAVYRMAPAGK
ncbi:MAG: PQQ-dependent sugar dehydrogenase [Paracoccaceae bacterium]